MRYAHTNLVARDWRRLADFYSAVFACRFRPPARSQSGDWLERGTGVRGAALEGVHLELPGFDDGGPTLEIYSYSEGIEAEFPQANRCGFGHIAFEVEDVEATVEEVLRGGGSLAGEVTVREIERVGVITFVYARDPEGNLIELQSWG